MDNQSFTIGAVVVTYNRLEKLKKALISFDNQTTPPDYLIVVNNGSTDGTSEFLAEWNNAAETHFQKFVINNEKNLGGSEGFYTGMKAALDMGIDWIWVSDDDAYPEPDAFSILRDFIAKSFDAGISTVCSSVYHGKLISIGHRRRLIQKFLQLEEVNVPVEEYDKDSFDLDIYSYVGAVFDRKALESVGLPVREYFIHYDDSEHSLRVRKTGRIVCVPSIKVYHDLEYGVSTGYQWKDYYLLRNRMDAIRRNFPKRYYYVICCKRVLGIIFVWCRKDKTWAKLFTTAVTDAWKKKLGLHDLYKPGWRPE